MQTWWELRKSQLNRQLVVAVISLNMSQVRDCLRSGADPNIQATPPEHLSMWQVLLNLMRPRQNKTTMMENNSLLTNILNQGLNSVHDRSRCSEIALLLIQFGAHPEYKNDPQSNYPIGYYTSPLCVAVGIQSTEVVQALLDHGANVNPAGTSPLLQAANENNTTLALLLLSHGADPNSRSRFKQTPLIAAACHGNEVLVRALLKKKADLTLRDWTGRTALVCAREFKAQKIVELLKREGATQ